MLPGIELMACPAMAVPHHVMQHVVRVESSFNPYAIGVVGGRLVRQPRSLGEAVSTARMLEAKGYNFSLGLAQVNRYNLSRYGLTSYEKAFEACPNLQAGSRILAECRSRSGGDWGKAFSCYYSGNFVTGFRHGYVQKVFASMQASAHAAAGGRYPDAIPLAPGSAPRARDSQPPGLRRARQAGTTAAGSPPDWTRRIVAESRQPAATAPAPRPGAAATAPAPASAPAGAGVPSPQADEAVAVLAADGAPPRLVTAHGLAASAAPAAPIPASPPRSDAAPADAAFVF